MNVFIRLVVLCGLGVSGVQAENRTAIAVADFAAERSTQLMQGLPDLLAERLINSGRFDVYERDKLMAIIQEQQLQWSGFTDPQSAASLGKLAGVPYILTGIVRSGSEDRSFSGYGVRAGSTMHHLLANMRIIEVESGRVLFTRNESAEEMAHNQEGTRGSTVIENRLAVQVADQFIRALEATDLFLDPTTVQQERVTIRIESEPENADVEIGGIFYGNAGADFQVPAGIQQIEVSLPGYHIWSRKVNVRDGMSFKATLNRKSDIRIELDTQ